MTQHHQATHGTGNPYLGTFGNAIEIGEFGRKKQVMRECLVTTSYEKDAQSKQRYPGDDKNSYSKISFGHPFAPQ